MQAKSVRSVGNLSLAEFTSKMTNPCILSVVMLLAVLWMSADHLWNMIHWSAILVALLVALPLLYVYLRLYRNPNYQQSRPGLTLFLKRHPKDVLALGLIAGLPCWLVLRYMNVSAVVLDTMTALLAIAVLIAAVNLSFRASFHLASITTLIYMAVVIWGYLFLVLAVLIPLVAWAKYRLKDHTRLQLVVGFVLAVCVCSLVVFL